MTAAANGTSVTLTSKTGGAGSNYSLSVSAQSSDPSHFHPASFAMGESGPNMTGGGGGYNFALRYAPNGDVLSANDSVNGNWTYTYDVRVR